MSKTTGLSERLFVGAFDLSGDIGAIGSIKRSQNLQDVTVLIDTAVERLGLLYDGDLSYSGFFDTVAGQEHPVLSALHGNVNALYTWATGTTVGKPTGSLQALQGDYGVVRGADGSLVVNPTAVPNATGVEWGNLLTTGAQTFASAGSGASIDDVDPVYGVTSTALGAAGYLHVISVGSGSAVVAIQDSADNSSFANVTGLAFTGASGATSQRLATTSTATVRRYLRVNVTGTFTNARIVVSVVRNLNGLA